MKLLQFLNWWKEVDPMPEGVMAHEISDPELRKKIQQDYNRLHKITPTPDTHPENYDPLNPPPGWAYDPYYELWLEVNDPR